MSTDDKDPQEPFLSRWSRKKTEAREAPEANVAPTSPPPATIDEAPPTLPPIEELTLDSDFKPFFHPKVDETTRRAALRKLFSEPHFNVMDGLDTYIDDYSKTEPIPAAMLAGLKQAQRILEWAKDKQGAVEDRLEHKAADGADGANLIPSAPAGDQQASSEPDAESAARADTLDAPKAS